MFKSDFFVDYYKDRHGEHGIKPAGVDEWRLRECPFCGDIRWKFYYRVGYRVGKCYICCEDKRGFNVWQIIAQLEDVSEVEARRLYFEKALGEIRHGIPGALADEITEMLAVDKRDGMKSNHISLPVEYVSVYDKKNNKWSWPVYLTYRGISRQIAIALKIGYCGHGSYAGRIIFPIVCDGQTSFVARWAKGDHLLKSGMIQKVKNPPGSYHAVLLYNYDAVFQECVAACANGKKNYVYVVEGATDTVRMLQNKYSTTVALFGKTLHPAQIRLLLDLPAVQAYVIMLDPDAVVSAEAASRALMLNGAIVEQVLLDSVDPGDMTKGQADHYIDNRHIYTGESMIAAKISAKLTKSRM